AFLLPIPIWTRSITFSIRTTLHELGEGLRQRRLVREDVEHPTPFERRTQDPLVKPGRDVDAAITDAVVVGTRRCETFSAPLSRDASSGRVDGNGGIVVHPQHAASID